METCHEDHMLVDGEIKLELDVSEGDCDIPESDSDAVCHVVVEPASSADDSAQNVERRRSGRAAKKRSLLLPGENVVTGVRKYRHILPRPQPPSDAMRDGDDEDTGKFTIPRVIEVKEEASLPRKKRTYRPRKRRDPTTGERREPAVTENHSESVDALLGQLVSAYCGSANHPTNCQDCQNRVQAIRVLLQTSGTCQETNTSDDQPAAMSSLSTDSHGPHSSGTKQCSVCHRHLAARTSMTVVSNHLIIHTVFNLDFVLFITLIITDNSKRSKVNCSECKGNYSATLNT